MGARQATLRSVVEGREDPAAERDLTLIPIDELRNWLRIEQNVIADYGIKGGDVQRTRWAISRSKRISAELRRRSGRVHKEGAGPAPE